VGYFYWSNVCRLQHTGECDWSSQSEDDQADGNPCGGIHPLLVPVQHYVSMVRPQLLFRDCLTRIKVGIAVHKSEDFFKDTGTLHNEQKTFQLM